MAINPYNNPAIWRERYFEDAPNYAAITRDHEYEDAGKSFNETSDTAPQTWELIYTGLKVEPGINEAIIFDEHYAAHRLVSPFLFIDKFGDSHAVFYQTFERSHDKNKSRVQQRRIVLIEYPGVTTEDLPDETPPTIPELSMSHTSSSITGTWTESTDDESGLDHYLVTITLGS